MKALIASSAVVAAIVALTPGAFAQQRYGFCLRSSDSGALNCSFNTIAQCRQAMRGADNTGTCVPNPTNPGTTGQGSAAKARQGK
jgi:hypothetical protein